MDERLVQFDEKMQKTMNNLSEEFGSIRAGRANPHVLDKLKVDYYGTPTAIQQVANVNVPEPRMIQIQPWEASMVKEIEKAILTSDLGINPTNDGKVIRLLFPELTEERRKELAKDVKKKGENAKVAIRNIRRDANDSFKKLSKSADVSEDEVKELEDGAQKMTDKYITEIDKAVEAKTKENMTMACPHFHFMNECRHKVCRLWKGVVITMKIPQHVAIILDGNGRWAKSKGMPRNYGHTVGAKNVETVCKAAHDMGIKYLTMYAFSTENWNRPEGEVAALMKLLESYLKNCINTADKNNMRVRVIGDTTRLSERFQKQIVELEAASAKNDGLNLQIAINYGSRDEMIRAMKKMYHDMENGSRQVSELNEDMFASYLDTAGIPDPDLLIRTSGEQRLSNYLLWQLAYSEFYFTDVPWPDFGKEDLEKAVEAYNKRDRRFGGLAEEAK